VKKIEDMTIEELIVQYQQEHAQHEDIRIKLGTAFAALSISPTPGRFGWYVYAPTGEPLWGVEVTWHANDDDTSEIDSAMSVHEHVCWPECGPKCDLEWEDDESLDPRLLIKATIQALRAQCYALWEARCQLELVHDVVGP